MGPRAARGRRTFLFAVLALAAGATACAAATTASGADPAATPPAAPVLSGAGSAEGGLQQIRKHDTQTSKNRLISDENLTLRASLSFTFGVASDGTLTGTGTGQYTQAGWSLTGTRGGAPFSCSLMLVTSPFTVTVTGKMRGGDISIRLILPDAREVVPRTDCGAGYIVAAQTTTALNGSLTNLEGRGLAFDKAPFSQSLKKDQNRSGGVYPSWNVHHEWTVQLTPPACPSSLDSKASKSYGAGLDSLRAANRQIGGAQDTYFKFRREEGTNYFGLLGVASQARKTAAEGAGQVRNFWSRPELTTPWIERHTLAGIRRYNRAIAAAKKAWRAADVQLKRSITEAEAAKPIRVPCEPGYKQVGYFAGRRISLAGDKVKLIAQWERSRGLSMSPSAGPLARATRFYAAARNALPRGSRGATVSVSSAQLLAASSRMTSGLALQKQAMKLQDRAVGAAAKIRGGLLKALRR